MEFLPALHLISWFSWDALLPIPEDLCTSAVLGLVMYGVAVTSKRACGFLVLARRFQMIRSMSCTLTSGAYAVVRTRWLRVSESVKMESVLMCDV